MTKIGPVVVDAERVTPVDVEIFQAIRTFKSLGQGTATSTGLLGRAR